MEHVLEEVDGEALEDIYNATSHKEEYVNPIIDEIFIW